MDKSVMETWRFILFIIKKTRRSKNEQNSKGSEQKESLLYFG